MWGLCLCEKALKSRAQFQGGIKRWGLDFTSTRQQTRIQKKDTFGFCSVHIKSSNPFQLSRIPKHLQSFYCAIIPQDLQDLSHQSLLGHREVCLCREEQRQSMEVGQMQRRLADYTKSLFMEVSQRKCKIQEQISFGFVLLVWCF